MKNLLKQIAILTMLFLLANSMKAIISNAEELPESPAFHACIEYSSQGYVVKGSLTEIPPDISLIQPLYSLDGEAYQACGVPWNLQWLDIDDANAHEKLQNQTCLYSNQEPLKSYLDKKLDRFYIKLRLTLNNEATYETQAMLIDRGSPQPVSEELHPEALFASSMAMYERNPFCRYGKYQLTVSANATPEDIASFLPDTLPIEIQLTKDNQFTNGIVDCPVTWKHLSLPQLVAGESVTINDAAEEIVVPEGILLNTPTGIFQIQEPLKLSDQYGLTDEVRLVLNVIAEDENPTGALSEENTGLEICFHLKPTGATSIHAYVLSENSTVWTNLPALPLLDAVNAQPSTSNSGYALILSCDQEPYRTYLAQIAAENNPGPFYIGLEIKGGVYDRKQLILAWPDTYVPPLSLPKLSGSGGNEANAGADNKSDSTPEGQRPNLPQTSNGIHDVINIPEMPSQNPGNAPTAQSPAAASPKTGSSSIIKPVLKNQSDVENVSSGDTPADKNPPAETTPDTKYDTQADISSDIKYDVQAETLSDIKYDVSPASSTQNGNINVAPDPPEIPVRKKDDKNHKTFPPLAAVVVAVIGITAAAYKITTSGLLQKLHNKCRTLTRR